MKMNQLKYLFCEIMSCERVYCDIFKGCFVKNGSVGCRIWSDGFFIEKPFLKIRSGLNESLFGLPFQL